MPTIADEFAKEQKEIAVSQFFEKNKHLLGFDNPTKALLMIVKEGVDNSLDACEEADILPDIEVKVKNLRDDVFKISIKDNGPGITKKQLPRIFGKLLYGSKFHRLMQSRGQQGIGISAAVLYSQLTTGEPAKVWSRTDKNDKAHYLELHIDSLKNEPEIIKEEVVEKDIFKKETGTKIELIVTGRYRKAQGIEEYLKLTSISNPFARIVFTDPYGEKTTFQRSVPKLPKRPKQIKPHPYGVEFGILLRMLKTTKSRTLSSFLRNEFSSIGASVAKEICKTAKVKEDVNPLNLERSDVEKILRAMQSVKVQRPPLDCLSPIGKDEFRKSLEKEYPDAEIITTITRDPAVYRGNPFQIEVGIVYGAGKKDNTVDVFRFANRVPLLYQAGAGAIVESVKGTSWKRYGLQQSGNNIPIGPAIIIVHMASSWVPFISESKEAIATYPNIIKEMKLAVQTCARDLKIYLNKKQKSKRESQRLHIFEDYFPIIQETVSELAEEKVDLSPILKKVVKTEKIMNGENNE